MSEPIAILPHQEATYKPGPIPAEAAPFMGIMLAGLLHSDDVSGFLRRGPDWSLGRIAVHILEQEPGMALIDAAFGLPYQGPSWWASCALPQIVEELERREKPKATSSHGAIAALKALDIASVAQRFTDLKPAGHNRLKGICPMHDEKTASFFIYGDAQKWRCYGACATGGDVIDLLARLSERGPAHV